jgi:ATP-dependent exoDNAse (exonuclease V) beta subunit
MNREDIPLNSLHVARGGPPHITRVTGRSRYYEVDGLRYPSVTSVLGKVYPKPALYNWFAKRGREAMRDYLVEHIGEPISDGLLEEAVAEAKIRPAKDASEAADLGSQAHDLISAELLGQTLPVPPALEAVMDSFHSWRSDERLTLVDSETAVVGDGYAGTIDALWQREDGSYLLVDWKTSKGLYQDHSVQVATYARLLRQHTNVRVDAALVRLGKEEAEWEVLEVEADQCESLDNLWDAAFGFYMALKENKA